MARRRQVRHGRGGWTRADAEGLANGPGESYAVRMKRTNLVLDEALLDEATRLSGERTYSRTVERALRDFVARAKARRILELAGSGLWKGDLSVVREDRGVYRTGRRGAR
jgi:Arc/MetJ family transcription regulator